MSVCNNFSNLNPSDSIPSGIPEEPQQVTAALPPLPQPLEVRLEAMKKSYEVLKKRLEALNNGQPTLTQEFDTPRLGLIANGEMYPSENSLTEQPFSSTIDLSQYDSIPTQITEAPILPEPQQVPATLPQPLTEQVEKKWKLEGTIIVGDGHRKTLGEITDGEILWKFKDSLGSAFVIKRNAIQTITLKNAYVVTIIAGRVFDLEKITENDVKFSLIKNQLCELHNELQPYLDRLRPETLDKFRDLRNGHCSFFNIDFAKQLNVHLKIPIDLAAAKSYAKTKAEEEVSKTCSNYLVHASYVQAGKIRKQKTSIPKRPLSASSENPDAPPSKIQRPNANGQQTAFDVHAVHRNRGSFNIPPPMPVSNTSLSIPNASTTFLEIPPPIPVVNKPVPPSNESTIVPELNSGSHATNKSNSSLDPSISTSNSSQFGANDFYTLGGENWFWENTSQEWT